MKTKLLRIAEISRNNPKEIFTSLYHLINKELLLECHKELDGNKAVGIDKITKLEYCLNLDKNIEILVVKLIDKAYIPTPSKRINIPKANGKTRPLGIAIYEDKIVQLALKKIIESIYEPKFLDCMYGFRPNRGCHDAIIDLTRNIEVKKTNYIIDADIKSFFDNVSHNWLMKCLELHIKDPNILRLVMKFLKAGIIENKEYKETNTGTPQGSILSPVLANIYMHYVQMHSKVNDTVNKLNVILRGYYNYYCITDNIESVRAFHKIITNILFKALRRRSQKNKLTYDMFYKYIFKNIIKPVTKIDIIQLSYQV